MERRQEMTCPFCFIYMEVRDAHLDVLIDVFCHNAKADCKIGGFITGSKDGVLSQPGGMILQSIANGHPIIHVEINYRLNGKLSNFLFQASELICGQSSVLLRPTL